jgi:general nucleoside transport system permease protein
MTATTAARRPGSPRSMGGFLDDSPPYVRPILYAVGGLALLSLVRIIADAPDLTAGDTFIAAIGAMSPIVFAALGGLFAERVGVINIGLEGMMVLGTWSAGWAGWHWGPYAAIIAGAIGGMLGGLLLALATVTFGVDHIVAGIAINLLAPGVCRFLSSEVFAGKGDGSITQSPGMSGTIGRFTFPFLAGGSLFGWRTPAMFGWLDDKRWFLISDIAGLGRGFTTGLAFTTILALALLPISAYVLWRTPFGLRLRSIGEKPSAAESLGVAVYRMKYIGVAISGAMAGLGGAWLAIDIRAYNQDQVAGRGFQGLAALIFGNYRPAGIGAGAGLFAFAQSLTQRIGTAPVRALFLLAALIAVGVAIALIARRKQGQAVGAIVVGALALVYYLSSETVNNQIVFITPYLVTLLVLTFASQHLRPPAAEGRPWRKGDIT